MDAQVRLRRSTKPYHDNDESIGALCHPHSGPSRKKCDTWKSVLMAHGAIKELSELSSPEPLSDKICDQVKLDIDRAFCFDSGLAKLNMAEKRENLHQIILNVLEKNSEFKYYQVQGNQGYLFSIVFADAELKGTQKCVEIFAEYHLKPFIGGSFDQNLKYFTKITLEIASRFTLEHGFLRKSTEKESTQFRSLLEEIEGIIDPHGLFAGWFLTWFVHEFPDFGDSLRIFDFQLTRIDSPLAPVYIASALIIFHKQKLVEWEEGSFELVVFLRNLPKISRVNDVLRCSQLLLQSHPVGNVKSEARGDRFSLVWRGIIPFSHFGSQFWIIVVAAHLLYYLLIMTVWPNLKYL